MIPKTIKKRSVFLKVARDGYVAKTRNVVSICLKTENSDDAFVGYTASRKVGNSVSRNFAKRRLRALVREFESEIAGGCMFVFIATRKTVESSFSELRADFLNSLRKAKCHVS